MKYTIESFKANEEKEEELRKTQKEMEEMHQKELDIKNRMKHLLAKSKSDPERQEEYQTELIELQMEKHLLLFNLSLLESRMHQKAVFGVFVEKVSCVDYCCNELEKVFQDSGIFEIQKGDWIVTIKNAIFHGDAMVAADFTEMRFCPYCGAKVVRT